MSALPHILRATRLRPTSLTTTTAHFLRPSTAPRIPTTSITSLLPLLTSLTLQQRRPYAKKAKKPKPGVPQRHIEDHDSKALPSPSQLPVKWVPPEDEISPTVLRTMRQSSNVADHVKAAMRHMVHPVVIVTTGTSPDPSDWRGITLSSFNTLSLDPEPLISFNIRNPSECGRAMLARGEFVVHTLLPTPRAADFAARFSQPYIPGQDWKYSIRAGYKDPVKTNITALEKQELDRDKDMTPEERNLYEEIWKEGGAGEGSEEGFEGRDSEAKGNSTVGARKAATPPAPVVLNKGKFARIPLICDATTNNLPILTEEVMFRFYCTIHCTAPMQDHDIWVAKVTKIDYPGEWPNLHGAFGIEESAPLSLLYGDRTFREAGLRMIERNNKFRRWFRRKIEFEESAKMGKLQKLYARLERVRERLRRQAEAGARIGGGEGGGVVQNGYGLLIRADQVKQEMVRAGGQDVAKKVMMLERLEKRERNLRPVIRRFTPKASEREEGEAVGSGSVGSASARAPPSGSEGGNVTEAAPDGAGMVHIRFTPGSGEGGSFSRTVISSHPSSASIISSDNTGTHRTGADGYPPHNPGGQASAHHQKTDPVFRQATKGIDPDKARELKNWQQKVKKKKIEAAKEKNGKRPAQPWAGRGRRGGR